MILRSCGHVEPHGHMVRDGHMIQCQRWSGTGGEGRGRGRGEKKKGRGMGGEGRGREEGRERNGMGRGGKRRGFGRYVRSRQVWGRLRRIDLGQPGVDGLIFAQRSSVNVVVDQMLQLVDRACDQSKNLR